MSEYRTVRAHEDSDHEQSTAQRHPQHFHRSWKTPISTEPVCQFELFISVFPAILVIRMSRCSAGAWRCSSLWKQVPWRRLSNVWNEIATCSDYVLPLFFGRVWRNRLGIPSLHGVERQARPSFKLLASLPGCIIIDIQSPTFPATLFSSAPSRPEKVCVGVAKRFQRRSRQRGARSACNAHRSSDHSSTHKTDARGSRGWAARLGRPQRQTGSGEEKRLKNHEWHAERRPFAGSSQSPMWRIRTRHKMS